MFQLNRILIAIIILFGYCSYAQSIDSIALQTDNIIHQMHLKQKVFEMSGRGINRFALSFMFTRKLIPVTMGGNKKLGIPSVAFMDGPRGVSFYKGATAFPVSIARAATWDRSLEHRVGIAMSEEIRALGGNYSSAVCVNLLRHPANGRAQESYGEDPYLVGEMGLALMQGLQSNQVQACVKHFALNSMENNRFGGNIQIDERSLHEVYLPHFKKIIQAGAASVMSAYNKVNGAYCGENAYLLNEILRQQWGFKGYVSTDWQFGLFNTYNGIQAQTNIEMPSPKYYSYKNIKQFIQSNRITESTIDALIKPIIYTKLQFEKETIASHKIFPKNLVACANHIQLAREVAEEGIVLLKNEQEILPLQLNRCKHIIVTGSLTNVIQTGDKGSSNVIPPYIVSMHEALTNYVSGNTQVHFIASKDLAAAKQLCIEADAILVLAGNTFEDEGEFINMGKLRDSLNPDKQNMATHTGLFGLGGDKKYLHLHENDIQTIQDISSISDKVIVCLSGGSVITVEEWELKTAAILHTFYSGMEGANALVKILFGDVNPSGKLPFSIPKQEADLPYFNSFRSTVNYDYYHGYTLLNKTHTAARYAFGYGLSYTQFKISQVHTDKEIYSSTDTIQLSCVIQNVGQRQGAEVIQCYVGFEQSKIDRASQLLKGFEKVFLLPQETQTIHMSIPVSDLAWYNADTHQLEIEQMTYTLKLGNQSNDPLFQTTQIQIK